MKQDLTELAVKDFDKWGEAVGGAGGVADDGVAVAVAVSVDTNDVGGDVSLAGGSDEHLLRAGLDVLPGAVSVDEHSSSLDHKINAQLPNATDRGDLNTIAKILISSKELEQLPTPKGGWKGCGRRRL